MSAIATRLAVRASAVAAGAVIKLFILTAFLLASLAVSVPAQSTTPAPTPAYETGTTQDKKNQTANTRPHNEISKAANANAGKKTSSAQDAAYAAAYKAGIPK